MVCTPCVTTSIGTFARIPHFTVAESTTAQQHVDRMNDAFDYMELEDETIKMRMFAQTLGGDPRNGLKS